MKHGKDLQSSARRAFFRQAGLGVVGAAGAAAIGLGAAPQAPERPRKDDRRARYRETAHVRRVYELARG